MLGHTTHVTLLQRLANDQGGQRGSWVEFCDRYEALIRGYAFRRGVSAADCDDVVQDVLLALTRAMPQFQYDPAKGRFRAYLHTVVSHAILRRWRQKPPEVALEDGAASFISDGADADDHWETEWRQHHLRLAMKTVSAEFNAADRAAFESYAIEGRTVHETCQALGVSADQVYQAKSRILKRLAALIHQQVQDEG